MIDLNEMAIFVTVVDCGSFTKASDQLDIPLSSISRKMAQLEERLGVRLLHRTTRKLQLTDIGTTYHAHCKRMMNEVDEAEFAVKQLQSEPSGLMRIVAPFSFDSSFASQMMSSFLKAHPKISMDLVQSTRDIDLIEERFDCAFKMGPLNDSSLISRSFGSVSAILCASPRYLEFNGTPETIADLHNHTLIGLPLIKWEFGNNGRSDEEFSFRIKTTEITMARQFVLDGCGIALLPSIHMMELLEQGEVVQILPEAEYKMHMYLVYPSNRQISTRLRSFIDHTIEHCRESAPWDFE